MRPTGKSRSPEGACLPPGRRAQAGLGELAPGSAPLREEFLK